MNIKRVDGKTPNELRELAEAERDQLRSEVESLRKTVEDLRGALADEMLGATEPPLTEEDRALAEPFLQKLVDSGMFTRDEAGRLVPDTRYWSGNA